MEYLTLINGEFRSLIRNTLERLIGDKMKKPESKEKQILMKLAIRVVSSLIAIQLFRYLQQFPQIKKYTSLAMVVVFVLFLTNKL